MPFHGGAALIANGRVCWYAVCGPERGRDVRGRLAGVASVWLVIALVLASATALFLDARPAAAG